MNSVRLQILICTYGAAGLRRVADMKVPSLPGIGYVVSCQDPEGTVADPRELLPERADMEVFLHADRGLGLNRRHAMRRARARFVLIADDDLRYDATALQKALDIMESHSDTDVFAFRYSGADNKIYPPAEHDLALPYKNYNLTSFELAFRLDRVREAGVEFSPLLGVGAPRLTAAEETIFTERCLQAGLRGRFFPLTIVSHPGLTTGYRAASSPGVIRSTAAYIRIKHGVAEGLLRCILLAHRAPVPFFKGLWYGLQGMVYSIKHNKEL